MNSELDDFDGLLNWKNLQRWIQEQNIPGVGPITSVTRVTSSGSQNNIFILDRQGATIVLRRPPKHLRPTSNIVMTREARVLAAIEGSKVPHPTLYAACDDAEVIGTYFNIMSRVDGFTPHGQLPGKYGSDPAWRRAMAFAIVDAASSLGQINPDEVDLVDFGKPRLWVERQVGRWRSQLDGYSDLKDYPGPQLPAVDDIGKWLGVHQPSEYRNGVIHGDYQFANVMFSFDEPLITAVVDWELSTLGDPLLDLGWILASWDEPGDPEGHDVYVAPFTGFPSRAEIVDRYLQRTGRSADLVLWYSVLACYKEGILLEGTWARALSGLVPMETGERLHRNAVWYFARAAQLINA